MKKLCALLALLVSPAFAQSATGNVTFTRPTQYTDGSALPAAAITGYEVRCVGFTPTGGTRGPCTQFPTVTLAGTALSGVITGTVAASGGTAYFAMITKTATGDSALSNEASKVFAPLVPNPPGNVTVAVVIGINMAPVYKLTSTGKRSPDPAGYVALSTECTGNVLFRFREVNFRKVDPALVQWFRVTPSDNIAAACT